MRAALVAPGGRCFSAKSPTLLALCVCAGCSTEGSQPSDRAVDVTASGSVTPVAAAPPTAAETVDPPAAGAPPPATAAPWAVKLSPLLLRDINTLADVHLRLYRDDGSIDEDAASEASRVLWASKDSEPPHVSRRLMQLVVKAAAHFDAHEIQVISSHRGKARKGSRHRTGEAIDFVFPGVPPKTLATYLRTMARVGVGLYVHPRSQFVHLDVREQSYHWIDGSPPGRSWREQPLPDPTAAARDAAYDPSQDLP